MGIHPGCPVCSVVAASLVAVETDVGETISAAKVVCGLWSVGFVALLSAGPSRYFCIHQLLFPCLEVFVQSASPHHAVGCKVLPGLGVDVKCFHVSLADILVAQLWAVFESPSRCQLSIEIVCLLVAERPSNMLLYLRDGSAQTISRAAGHTEIELADPTFHLTQSQYTDAGPTSPSADPITLGAWQGSHWSANF